MINLSHEGKERLLFGFSFVLAVISVLAVVAYIGAQTYVRWSINKDFTFLGGNELEVLTASAFALVLVLVLASGTVNALSKQPLRTQQHHQQEDHKNCRILQLHRQHQR